PDLNGALRSRQHGSRAPIRWARRPGVWLDAPLPPASAGRIDDQGRYLFLGNSAIRLGRSFAPGADGRLRIGYAIDPVVGDRASLGWISLMLSARDTRGWVTDRDHVFAMLVRSNGAIQVFARGTEVVP